MSEQPRDNLGRFGHVLSAPPSSSPVLPRKSDQAWELTIQRRDGNSGEIIHSEPVQCFATRQELETVLLNEVSKYSRKKDGVYITGWIHHPNHTSHLADPLLQHMVTLQRHNPESESPLI